MNLADSPAAVTLPQRAHSNDRRKALAVATLCWAGFAAAAFAVHAGRADTLDQTGLLFWRDATLQPLGPAWLLEGVRDVTALGGVVLRNLFALGAVAALLFLALRREAMLFALTVASGWLVNSGLKHLVGRPRPAIVPHLTEAGGASFPSGHSFNAAVVYVAMALAFAALSARRSVRRTLVGTAMLATLAIALSRVWLGVHWPSDILAGWLGGMGWAFLASALLYRPAASAAAVAEDIKAPGTGGGRLPPR